MLSSPGIRITFWITPSNWYRDRSNQSITSLHAQPRIATSAKRTCYIHRHHIDRISSTRHLFPAVWSVLTHLLHAQAAISSIRHMVLTCMLPPIRQRHTIETWCLTDKDLDGLLHRCNKPRSPTCPRSCLLHTSLQIHLQKLLIIPFTMSLTKLLQRLKT